MVKRGDDKSRRITAVEALEAHMNANRQAATFVTVSMSFAQEQAEAIDHLQDELDKALRSHERAPRPDGWVRYKDNGGHNYIEGAEVPDPKVYGSGWIALYRLASNMPVLSTALPATGETPRTDALLAEKISPSERKTRCVAFLYQHACDLERELALWQRDNGALHRACEGYRAILDKAAPSSIAPFAWVVESEYERGDVTVRECVYHDTKGEALIDQERHGGKVSPLYLALPSATALTTPIPMVLHCPACGLQHVDAQEWPGLAEGEEPPEETRWKNPPHRSHLCHGCGAIWRPADVETNGVKAISTRGKADTWPLPEFDSRADGTANTLTKEK